MDGLNTEVKEQAKAGRRDQAKSALLADSSRRSRSKFRVVSRSMFFST